MINWHRFGNVDQKVYMNRPVTERFTYRSKKLHSSGKRISKIEAIASIANVHHTKLKAPFRSIDTQFRTIYSIHNTKGSDRVAYLNHYVSKSVGECLERSRSRFRGTTASGRRTTRHCKTNIYSEVEDEWAKKFYRKIKK